jgi:hypothetical protein
VKHCENSDVSPGWVTAPSGRNPPEPRKVAVVPTLSPSMLGLLGLALVAAALVLMRRH